MNLVKIADRTNVVIQVLPFSAQTSVDPHCDFVVLRFGTDITSDVVYLEDLTDATYLDHPDVMRSYDKLWGQLGAAALGPGESRQFILTVADEMMTDGP